MGCKCRFVVVGILVSGVELEGFFCMPLFHMIPMGIIAFIHTDLALGSWAKTEGRQRSFGST